MKRSLIVMRMFAFSFMAVTALSAFVTVNESEPLKCEKRGGTDKPDMVQQLNECTVQQSSGTGITLLKGVQCKCKTPPSGYAGTKGCDNAWETVCQPE
ncbi:hypothetical protein MKQ68_09160 [Chitinophaga horti]|uniref:Uncharacterized protein n=1 Tax=Chitinophaga horti TaxID=2920382 RepID=A0ABY6JAE3_9BACT|nr:hypothetical protein [Chitinophaga horti]UYQ95264.1 hypothetical protein MKQ68_09160 [Chitinophaga horti]